jgi:ABC-type lipoprotein release transport system permease subunit
MPKRKKKHYKKLNPKYLSQNGIACENCCWLESGRSSEKDIYFISQLPSDIHLEDVVKVGGMAFGLSLLATLYPSSRASRVKPAEALRYE